MTATIPFKIIIRPMSYNHSCLGSFGELSAIFSSCLTMLSFCSERKQKKAQEEGTSFQYQDGAVGSEDERNDEEGGDVRERKKKRSRATESDDEDNGKDEGDRNKKKKKKQKKEEKKRKKEEKKEKKRARKEARREKWSDVREGEAGGGSETQSKNDREELNRRPAPERRERGLSPDTRSRPPEMRQRSWSRSPRRSHSSK